MEIHVRRQWAEAGATIGELSIDGAFECFTLEDEVRDGDIFTVKVPGATAIPAGRYAVVITRSQRDVLDDDRERPGDHRLGRRLAVRPVPRYGRSPGPGGSALGRYS